jgi:hypothetical protein
MLHKLKSSLVESYIGALALGWLLADALQHAVGIFVTPLSAWASQRDYHALINQPSNNTFPFYIAGPEALRTALLFALWYSLLHWLYLKPAEPRSEESHTTEL